MGGHGHGVINIWGGWQHTARGLAADPALCLPAGERGFFDGTRYPSDRRPVRVANLQLALGRFARAGMALQGATRTAARGGGLVPLAAGDLVDGDREMTLCLLWRLILHFQLPQLVSLAAVRAEVELVRAKAPATGAAAAAAAAAIGQPPAATESAHVAALLEWTQAVCAHYGMPVRSFGACFRDGSVFCLLVRSSQSLARALCTAAPNVLNKGNLEGSPSCPTAPPVSRCTTIWATPMLH